MPKNRSTVYTVVRERYTYYDDPLHPAAEWVFDTLIGTYLTLMRAEEIAGKTIQAYVDAGMDKDDPEYRCTVKPSTWYEE